jgi:hypothetical protein
MTVSIISTPNGINHFYLRQLIQLLKNKADIDKIFEPDPDAWMDDAELPNSYLGADTDEEFDEYWESQM